MLYKNKKGIVHNLKPDALLTKRWLKDGNITPLTDAEKKAYLGKVAEKKAAPAPKKVLGEGELPPAPAREEMVAEHTALFGKEPMATMKDENLWKKILDEREKKANVDANATEGK